MSLPGRNSVARALVVMGAALALTIAVACAESGPQRVEGPTSGLKAAVASDSAGNPVPPATGTPDPMHNPDDTVAHGPGEMPVTPGYFRGVVRGSEVVNGPDTLQNSVRIANVKVTAYPATKVNATGEPETGAAIATTTTNANGEFQLPELPGGRYVVTFVPPEGSKYQGVWVLAYAHEESGDWPWWVTLPNK